MIHDVDGGEHGWLEGVELNSNVYCAFYLPSQPFRSGFLWNERDLLYLNLLCVSPGRLPW
jgi:hypothetical protein